MQTATSETEIKSLYLSICVHHYTLRAPCPKGQGTIPDPVIPSADPNGALIGRPDHSELGFWKHLEAPSSIQSDGVRLHNNGPVPLSALFNGTMRWTPNSFSLLRITTTPTSSVSPTPPRGEDILCRGRPRAHS